MAVKSSKSQRCRCRVHLGRANPANSKQHKAQIVSVDVPAKKSIKSPLRYPGGKSRAVKKIISILPPNLDVLVSPFFGGGSVELAMASQGTRVFGYDAFKPLVLFWQRTFKNPSTLARAVEKYYPLKKEEFYELQRMMREKQIGDSKTATIFFVLNRASFSGTTMSGGMSPGHKRFTKSAIEHLKDFKIKNLSVEFSDFSKSISYHKNNFLYCDPPYANGGALYGQRGDCHADFDHIHLAKLLKNRDKWILSYNDCGLVRDLYQGFKFVETEWTYGMSNNKKSNEVIILSNDIA